MSVKNNLDWRDWRSVGRHVFWPIVGGAALAGLDAGRQVFLSGQVSADLILSTSWTAFRIALLAGGGRLIQRLRLELGNG